MTTPDPTITMLLPSAPRKHLRGMGNLLRKELGQWWTTKFWWIQAITWIVILNGITTMIMLDEGITPMNARDEAMSSFLLIGATAIGIGVVLSLQGAIVAERELGTAAWVMSKPVTRSSFVLAKVIAHSAGFLFLAVSVPALIFMAIESTLLGLPIRIGPYVLGVAVVALAVLFYIALTLALGTVFHGRGPIAGIGIGLLLAGLFFKGMLPQALVYLTPWTLGDVAATLAQGDLLDPHWYVPVASTAALTFLFTVFACRRFRRDEF